MAVANAVVIFAPAASGLVATAYSVVSLAPVASDRLSATA